MTPLETITLGLLSLILLTAFLYLAVRWTYT